MKSKKMLQKKWGLGEVYAYKLESALAKEHNLFGRYFLLQKIDEYQLSPQVIAPIVYVKITKDDCLPSTFEEYNQLEYVQVSTAKYEERFWPYDYTRLNEDIAEKEKRTYEVDEYGFLPKFRALLVLAARTHIPPCVEYVGCYLNASPPEKEFIPHYELNNRMVYWKKNAELFDLIMIKAFCGHNLRTLQIYKTGDGLREPF